MKMGMKTICIAAMLAIGLIAGTAVAETETDTTSPPQQQMRGTMMHGGMMGGGMMGGGMMGPGMMRGGMMGPGMMHGGMMGRGMMGSDPDNWAMGCNGMMGRALVSRMSPGQQQEFMNQTVELRKQMMEKRFAYMEAMRNPDTSPQDLAKIEKGMLELRTKMMDKMTSLQGKK
jgi:hypothetical protein